MPFRDELNQLRLQIRDTDRQIMELVATRQTTARKIAEVKLNNNLPLKDFKVEKVVLDANHSQAQKLGLYSELATELTQILIKYSVMLQDEYHGTQVHKHKTKCERILLVGGLGQMGQWLARFFDSFGHKVTLCDVNHCGTSEFPLVDDLATGAHEATIIVLTTPISRTAKIITSLIEMKTDALIIDICSLKSPLVRVIEDGLQRGIRIASIHPMFGPNVSTLAGRNIVLCQTKPHDFTPEAAALFADTTAQIIKIPLAQHDQAMAYVLGLSHLSNLVFGSVVTRSGMSLKELNNVGSTTFLAQMGITNEVVNEHRHLYYEIQKENTHTPLLLDCFREVLEDYRAAILNDNKQQFVELMGEAQSYFSDREQQHPQS